MSTSTPDRLLVSPSEAGHLLDVSRQSIYTLIAHGELDSVKIGRHRKVTLESIERLAAVGTA